MFSESVLLLAHMFVLVHFQHLAVASTLVEGSNLHAVILTILSLKMAVFKMEKQSLSLKEEEISRCRGRCLSSSKEEIKRWLFVVQALSSWNGLRKRWATVHGEHVFLTTMGRVTEESKKVMDPVAIAKNQSVEHRLQGDQEDGRRTKKRRN